MRCRFFLSDSFAFQLFFIFAIVFHPHTTAQEKKYYFYTGKTYGTESQFNPLSLLLNGSYDVAQIDGVGRHINKFPYRHATREIFQNLSNPISSIRAYGTQHFLMDQILPINFTPNHGQWWPNYNLHLIGGGMVYARTTEWYEYHNFPVPTLFSVGTMAAFHLLNEIVENGNYAGPNVDPIADIYFFDIGGMILFSFDNVKEFFSKEVILADWSFQPSFSLHDGSLRNNGQYFSFKWKFPSSEKWHLFYLAGIDALVGTAYKTDESSMLSVGIGLRNKKLVVVDKEKNRVTAKLVWNVGIFYDHENSLLASAFFSGTYSDAVTLNLYPGIITVGSFSPGLFVTVTQKGEPTFGVTTQWTPGIAWNKD